MHTLAHYGKERVNKNPEAAHWKLQELESVTEGLALFFAQHPEIFDDRNIRREMEVLERWRDSYHHDLVSKDAFFETSQILLTNLCDRLKLALDDMQRLEGEGGPPASKEQVERNESLLKAIRRIERILSKEPALPH